MFFRKNFYLKVIMCCLLNFLFSCEKDNQDDQNEEIRYNLTFNIIGNGRINIPQSSYSENDTLTITALPNSDYWFSTWSVQGEFSNINYSDISSTITITLKSDLELTANFETIEDGWYKPFAINSRDSSSSDWENDIYGSSIQSDEIFEIRNKQIVGVYSEIYDPKFVATEKVMFLSQNGKDISNKNYRVFVVQENDQTWHTKGRYISYYETEERRTNIIYSTEEYGDPVIVSYDTVIDTTFFEKKLFFMSEERPFPRNITEMSNPQGFSSDSIYNQIEFNNPESYFEVFKKDASRYGLNINHITLEDFDFDFEELDDFNGRGATAIGRTCNGNSTWVRYDPDDWEKSLDFDIRNDKIKVFWHEFGHSILDIIHNCDCYDIMYQGPGLLEEQCNSNSICSGDPGYNKRSNGFNNASERMFNGVGQFYASCVSNKSQILK